MELPDLILIDLLESASTPSSIAGRVDSTADVVSALLYAHRRNGHADMQEHGYLQIWKLTESGKARAEQLKASV